MDQFEQKTKTFVSWLQERGVKISPNVEIADFRHANMGRGLQVKNGTVGENEQLFTIPAKVFFHAGVSSEIRALTLKHDLDDWGALIVTMMALSNSPEWAPYFDVLPTQFNTPMFWDPVEATELLGPSGVLQRIGREAADNLYDTLSRTILQDPLFKALPEGSTSRASFHRFGSIVMAYSFDIPTQTNESKDKEHSNAESSDEDEEDEEINTAKVLIPLADLINEDSANANVGFEQGDLTASLTCFSKRTIEHMHQLYLPREDISSGERLRRLGYVAPDDHTFEAVDISLELVKACAGELGELDVDMKLERLEQYMGEIPDILEPSSIIVDGEKQLNYDDDLLLIVAALTAPEVKRKYLKNVVDQFADQQTMTAEAKRLLHAVLTARRKEYGDTQDPQSYSTRKGMAQYVLWTESRVLDDLLGGLEAIQPEGPLTKKMKQN